jgi:hypothetical protein
MKKMSDQQKDRLPEFERRIVEAYEAEQEQQEREGWPRWKKLLGLLGAVIVLTLCVFLFSRTTSRLRQRGPEPCSRYCEVCVETQPPAQGWTDYCQECTSKGHKPDECREVDN